MLLEADWWRSSESKALICRSQDYDFEMPCPTLPMFNWDAQLSAAGGSCRHVLHHAELPDYQQRVAKSREEPLGPWSAPEQWPGGTGGGCLGCGGAVGEPLSHACSSRWIMQKLIENVMKVKPWSFSKLLRCCVLYVCAESGTESTLWDCACRPDTRRTGGKIGCGKLSGSEKLLMHWAGSLFELSSYSFNLVWFD